MTYGFSVKNAQGQEIVYGSEESLQFWGRKDFTVTRTEPFYFISHDEPLFNIPINVPLLCFVGVSGNAMATDVTSVSHLSGGYRSTSPNHEYRVELRGDNTPSASINFSVYCFVPSKYFRNSQMVYDYGLELYNEDGGLAFTGERPSLVIKDYINPNTHYGVDLGYRNAITPVLSRVFEEEYDTDKTRRWLYGAVGNLDFSGPYNYKETVKYTSTIHDGTEANIKYDSPIFVIEADRYDSYPSVGNYTP